MRLPVIPGGFFIGAAPLFPKMIIILLLGNRDANIITVGLFPKMSIFLLLGNKNIVISEEQYIYEVDLT